MDAELIRRWNATVGTGDLVYMLGDMFWMAPKYAIPILRSMNGQKIMIRGNHDRTDGSEFAKCFAKITDYLEVRDGDRNIVLCHYPIPCYKNHYYEWLHFYGHVHSSFEWNMMENTQRLMKELYGKKSFMVNVGAMMPYMNYTPKTADEIVSGYLKWRGDNMD